MNFSFHAEKAAENLAKHGVSFEEAASAFEDPDQIVRLDEAHSFSERRLVLLGRSEQGRLLTVVYTERGAVTRLISAREATYRERNHYEAQFYD